MRLKWNPHSTHKTVSRPRAVLPGEEPSPTKARKEWLSRVGKARLTQQHIKDTTVKPRQAWAPQVLDTTDMWVDKGWWLGSALQ